MYKSKIKQISLAVCLAFMPMTVFSAGLGKLNVSSGLGEPLSAEVELLSVTSEELSSLSATIAPEEAYVAQGITRLGIHSNIRVELAKNAAGAPILKLKSALPISEPYLDMLLQVDWASGRLMREYTVLLDPPSYKSTPDASLMPSISVPSAKAKPLSGTEQSSTFKPETVKSSVKKSKKTKKAAVQNEATTTDIAQPANAESVVSSDHIDVTTQRGDTLSTIAKAHYVEGVSLDQMLVGIFEANKEAFSNDNMNRLKVGQIVRIPTKESLEAVSAKEARKTVKAHSANWNEYRNALAGAVADTSAGAESDQKQSASGKITTAEDQATPPKAGPQDVVKLSAGEKAQDKALKDNSKALTSKVTSLQEELTAKEKSLIESQDRVSKLELQIKNMETLLAAKSKAMSEVEKNAQTKALASAQAQQEVAKQEAAKQEAAKQEAAKQEAAKQEAAKQEAAKQEAAKQEAAKQEAAQQEAAKQEAAKQEAAKQEAAKQEAAKQEAAKQEAAKQEAAKQEAAKQEVVKQVKPNKPIVKKPVPAPQPVPEVSLVDTVLDSVSAPMLGALGGLGLLGVGWMFLRNRRKKDLDSFERGILTSGGLRANTVFGSTTGNSSVSDSSFLTDFAQSADGSMIDTNDVDPIAEAEVYMAYGRDAQAEEILKDAITKEPKRYELHLKLLELYANNKDAPSFETIAGELYTTLGAADPIWAKVIALGVTVEPSNPLYDASKITSSNVDDTQKLDASDFSNVAVTSQPDLDLSFADVSEAVLTEEEEANSVVMESFSNGLESETADVAFDLGLPDGQQSDANTSDLNLNVDEVATFSQSTSADLSADSSNLMDFDLSEFSTTDASEAVNEPMKAMDKAMDKTMDNLLAFDTERTQAIANSNNDSLDLPSFDLNFEQDELPSLTSSSEPQVAMGNEISFDLDMLDSADDTAIKLDEHHSSASSEMSTIDFSGIDLDFNATENNTVQNLSEVSGLGEIKIDFAQTSQREESKDVDVKLDLVQAYIEMGDKEGAKELLDEVLKEGSSAQQEKAKDLLKQVA